MVQFVEKNLQTGPHVSTNWILQNGFYKLVFYKLVPYPQLQYFGEEFCGYDLTNDIDVLDAQYDFDSHRIWIEIKPGL